VEVTDPATFQKYVQQVAPTVVPYGGHSLARGGKVLPVEGPAPVTESLDQFQFVQETRPRAFSRIVSLRNFCFATVLRQVLEIV
jgi:uncharacterized protein (DUF1330 family)